MLFLTNVEGSIKLLSLFYAPFIPYPLKKITKKKKKRKQNDFVLIPPLLITKMQISRILWVRIIKKHI